MRYSKMPEPKLVNKVIYGGKVLIDLTGDTISVDKLAKGVTAHDKSGATITGTNTFDSDTSDATAAVAEILSGKTAYVRGSKLTGTMPNRGAHNAQIMDKNVPVNIPQGYHDGSGKVSINADDASKLIPANIRNGVEILGVTGSMSGTEDVKAQSKEVAPTTAGFTVMPDEGFNYLSQVKIKPIPYVLTDNAGGGQTATIG